MSAPPSDALDLLRFLALSLEVHTDAICSAVDDAEAAIVESSINDERMDRLEEELARLLERQRRLHAGRAIIALSQEERRRGNEVRRTQLQYPTTQPWGDKRIQTSRTASRASSTVGGAVHSSSLVHSPSPHHRAGEENAEDATSTRCVSTASVASAEPSLDADVAAVDRQVELLKAQIEELDCYSLRGKLLQLEKMKKAVKDIDLDDIANAVVDNFEFPAAVRALWSAGDTAADALPLQAVDTSYTSASASSSSPAARHGAPSRSRRGHTSEVDVTLAQHATGKGNTVNHRNIDLLLARACQRLTGRSVDALEALTSTNVSEESAAAHVLGCMIYATEFDRGGQGDLQAVMDLQNMPGDALTHFFHHLESASVCRASLDAQCFGTRQTVLAAQDFSGLPADWTTTQALSTIPLEEVLPPVRHLLSPRFTFANVAELKELQATRVELQRKIVEFLLSGAETDKELLHGLPGSAVERAVASARLAVTETTPLTKTPHAWKTLVRLPEET